MGFKYKDCLPEETISRIQQIFRTINLEVTELWQNESSLHTFALRLVINGTNIGTNGKGITKEYARASAYAEFLERLQNNLLSWNTIDAKKCGCNFRFAPDEKIVSLEELLAAPMDPFRAFYEDKFELTAKTEEEKKNAIYRLHRIDFIRYGLEREFITLPFKSLRTEEIKYLPLSIYRKVYGSNGMCAGNSKYEALVEGLSEIMERWIQKRIITEKPVLPDVPISYLQRYEDLYQIFYSIKENKDYTCFLKDCSFGEGWPVAGLVIIKKNTGRYGIKLGCHPDYAIAIERAFTESSQGQDVYEYSDRSWLDLTNQSLEKTFNISNSYKIGLAQYPYQLFEEKTSWEFKECTDITELDNEQIFTLYTNKMIDKGYDVLIRDVSWLGFPSYHIIIPGFSEMTEISKTWYKALNTKLYVTELLKEPENIQKEQIPVIRSSFQYFSGSIMDNELSSYVPQYDLSLFPYEKYHKGGNYMMALCYYMEGDYKSAKKQFQYLYRCCNPNASEASQALLLMYLCEAMDTYQNIEVSAKYLNIFFDREKVETVVRSLKNQTKVLPNLFTKQIMQNTEENRYEDLLFCVYRKFG